VWVLGGGLESDDWGGSPELTRGRLAISICAEGWSQKCGQRCRVPSRGPSTAGAVDVDVDVDVDVAVAVAANRLTAHATGDFGRSLFDEAGPGGGAGKGEAVQRPRDGRERCRCSGGTIKTMQLGRFQLRANVTAASC
jgi:hypothetical protein